MKLTLVNFHSEEEISLDVRCPIIIGRGSLFGCSDKKVSRNHGKIEISPEGNVLLLALHTNPCFFMKNGLPPVQQLAKDKKQVLKNGDYIGLLPDSYWYKVVLENNDQSNGLECHLNDVRTESEPFHQGVLGRNDDSVSIQDECNLRGKLDVTKATNVNEDPKMSEDACERSKPVDQPDSALTERLKSLEKTKKLPLWMYEIDDFPIQAEQGNLRESFDTSDGNGIKFAERKDQIKKYLSTEDSSIDNQQNASSTISRETGHGEELRNNQEESVQAEKSNIENVAHGSGSVSYVNEDDAGSSTKNINLNSGNSLKRPICQYEGKCYRINEEHRRAFCHIGDPDFVPYEKRPKCQYGASCYRRNKTHHVEYQHPPSVKPKGNDSKDLTKRKRQRKKEKSYFGSSEEDNYDFEDPFINDASSDEYIPSDLDSDEDMSDETYGTASMTKP